MRSRLITQCSMAVGGLVISLVLAESASAAGRLAARVTARREAVALAAANAEAATAAVAAHPAYSVSACCPPPCITYRYRGHAPRCCCCEPTVHAMLTIVNPCTCCSVEVPVCLPACCTGEPTVCSGQGLLGRCVLTYTWCCGYQVTLRIKRNGDLIVVAPRA